MSYGRHVIFAEPPYRMHRPRGPQHDKSNVNDPFDSWQPFENALRRGGRNTPVWNVVPKLSDDFAKLGRNRLGERRERLKAYRLFAAEASEHAMQRGPQRIAILQFSRSAARHFLVFEEIPRRAHEE